MRRRPSPLTDLDIAHWAAYARQVRPLPGRAAPSLAQSQAGPQAGPPAGPQAGPQAGAAPPPPPIRAHRPAAALTTGQQPAGLDNATWNRFRDGRLAPARTLDLHGKTAQAAFHALERFLHAAYADRLRCVDIVTGRGKGETGGVIRRELPMWLNLPVLRHLVLAAYHPGGAHARPENTGATRLLLRRPR
jgi:DNA-nicking Smr family endonuclease